MNDLVKTEFFILMNENSQEITNEQMQRAYGKFITHVATISNVGTDLTKIIRKLNITRTELVFHQHKFNTSREKNVLKLAYLQKALSFLESEIDLLKVCKQTRKQPFKQS